jgi:hypothetical protein
MGRSHFNLFNKDTKTLVIIYIVHICACAIYSFVICYLFICASLVVHLFCLLFDYLFILLFDFILINSLFFHCSKEKRTILILTVFRYFDPVVPVQAPSSIRVNKHHTADSTNFVLV